VVSLKFTKGKYQSAKKDFEELLSEIEGRGYYELEAEIMIYIARCDYALGNKDKAIKTLFKVRKVLPKEADFWLTRFLVNSR
jgi:TolA-binding protein